MRITLIGHYPPPYGGVATLMTQMEAALSQKECRVSIFNLGSGLPRGENVLNFNTSNRVLEFFQLLRAFFTWDSDVFHYISASYRSFWLGTVCIALARLAGRRIVVSFVGGAFGEFIASLNPLKTGLARFFLRRAHGLISCNSEIEEVLGSLVPAGRTCRMSNCFPPCAGERLQLPPSVEEFLSSHSPIVCSTGATAPEYGLKSAVEAVGMLKERFPDIGFALVLTKYGDSLGEQELGDLIASLGLEKHVLVERNLPDFISLLERSDVLLRSALADGDSVSVREALFLGVPAVASDTRFRPEGVILFRKGDARDMSEKLGRALDEKGSRTPARTQKEAEENLDALLGIYRTVLETGETRDAERRFCAKGGRVGP